MIRLPNNVKEPSLRIVIHALQAAHQAAGHPIVKYRIEQFEQGSISDEELYNMIYDFTQIVIRLCLGA
jgi:hypothetical protein